MRVAVVVGVVACWLAGAGRAAADDEGPLAGRARSLLAEEDGRAAASAGGGGPVTPCEEALIVHRYALRTGGADRLDRADQRYRACFAGAGNAPGGLRYLHAALLWQRATLEWHPVRRIARWEWAAGAATAALDEERDPLAARLLARAAILAWRQATAREVAEARARRRGASPRLASPEPDGSLLRPSPLSPREERLLAALERYLDRVPCGDERVQVMFARATLLARHDLIDRAAPLLASIVEAYPEHETALYAANRLLDLDILAARYEQVEERARWLEARPWFYTASPGQDRTDLADRVRDVLALAHAHGRPSPDPQATSAELRALGEEYRRRHDVARRLVPDVGPADRLDELLYDAGLYFEHAGLRADAIAAFREVCDRYPRGRAAGRAAARLAWLYAPVRAGLDGP